MGALERTRNDSIRQGQRLGAFKCGFFFSDAPVTLKSRAVSSRCHRCMAEVGRNGEGEVPPVLCLKLPPHGCSVKVNPWGTFLVALELQAQVELGTRAVGLFRSREPQAARLFLACPQGLTSRLNQAGSSTPEARHLGGK